MKSILITGGCGYLGSRLLQLLATDPTLEGVTLRILDNLQQRGHHALMALPPSGHYQFIEGDILDPATLRLAMEGVDCVIHLAAIVSTPVSFSNSTWMEQINHWGTARLVETCLTLGIPRLIYASTTAVYGPGGPFTETDPCRPIGPYAQSKLRGEETVMAATSRGLNTTLLRLATLYGYAPTMRFDAAANHLAYLAATGRSLTIKGTGGQRRPVVHVADAARAILLTLHQPEETSSRILNVVASSPSVHELVEAIRDNRPDTPIRYTEQDLLTHLSFEATNDELQALGWDPEITLPHGLAELIATFPPLQPALTSQ